MESTVIVNEKHIKETMESMTRAGLDKLHVIADFDRTLTKAIVNGKKIPSLISVLRDNNYLTPDYPQKAHQLFDKYHAIEIDPDVPFEEKKEAMREWWTKHFDLLIKSGLNKKDLERAVSSEWVQLRDGFDKFARWLKDHQIPLIILSSSGLGQDAIEMYLKSKGNLSSNIYIISNSFEWNEAGQAIKIKQPIIHSLNKDETVVKDLPFYNVIEKRKNVLLLGDSPGDVEMIKGFEYENLIKIGFLSEDTDKNIEAYKKDYDVLILGDGRLDYVNDLLEKIGK